MVFFGCCRRYQNELSKLYHIAPRSSRLQFHIAGHRPDTGATGNYATQTRGSIGARVKSPPGSTAAAPGGGGLLSVYNCSLDGRRLLVPGIVFACVDHLLRNGMSTEGIFRVGTNKRRVDQV